ncbi:MAG: rhomboid family intramembrane serine protease [Sphingomonas sp.]|nr:rhomboid family intramembrane serine protease [Sphingomonas sp.]
MAGGTAIVSAIITLLGREGEAAIVAGFVPATVLHTLSAPDGLFLLPVWLTPLTATLVHGGLLHLGFNLFLLAYCGRLLEQTIGSSGLVALYVAGAYLAAAGEWALWPGAAVPMVGASGAISALVGGYALLFANQRVPKIGPIPERAVRIAWLLAAWVGIQLLVGIASSIGGPAIAIGAHIGGFVAGLLLARPLLLWRYRNA